MTPDELKELQATLWKSADDLRANSDLRSSEYSTPVMGLIFLKFADNKYRQFEDEILAEYQALKGTRREKALHEIAIAKCGFYLPSNARYSYLLNLPEEAEIDQALKSAMEAIEEHKPELQGVLPQDEYFKLTRTDKSIPQRLLRNFDNIPEDADGDLFGQIYEYFLSNFALAEGQGGGEFFTPRSVVRLMVEIIEPHHGTVFDPACGSGGMFVQSAAFVDARRQSGTHKKKQEQQAADALFVYGQEKTLETVKLAKMNLAVNGLRGEVQQTNTYYEDPYGSFGRFDYVLANPPFNVDDVNLQRVEGDPRFNKYGIPRKKSKTKKKDEGNETVSNGNYLWINLFATSLKEQGRAALVMANSASDARHSEADIRQTLIEGNLIYGMLTLPSNMFWTVTLPATLWFFDKGKADNRILFIDARNIFTQIDRAHREFSEAQIQNIAIISKLHRGERDEFISLVDAYFENGVAQMVKVGKLLPDVENRLSGLFSQPDTPAAPPVMPAEAGIHSSDKATSSSPPDMPADAGIHSSDKATPAPSPVIPAQAGIHSSETVDSSLRWNDTSDVTTIVRGFTQTWQGWGVLQKAYDAYQVKQGTFNTVEDKNEAQHQLQRQFDPFFAALHAGLKQLDKTMRQVEKEARSANGRRGISRDLKELKDALETLRAEVKDAEVYFGHIHWLQERFPNAEYEDVTGLCKLATLDDVKEQDYSLNPGRYVGVVIEEDGKTEEEFIDELSQLNKELNNLNLQAKKLEEIISFNLDTIID